MARPLRIQFPGAVYHVTSRGNAQQEIFSDDSDRELLLEILGRSVSRYGVACHAYCLMRNHYHLLVDTPAGNLSETMRHLNGVYTQSFNRRHRRVGHAFQGRYKAILVEREGHLLELARYVVLNPVRAGLCARAEEWPWSSYRATAGLVEAPPWLTTSWILSQLGRQTRRAQDRYREFVAEGLGSDPWPQLQTPVVLGSEEFAARYARLAGPEIPRSHSVRSRPPLAELLAGEGDEGILAAYRDHGYRLREIADALGVHLSTVSRRLAAAEEGRAAAPLRRRRRQASS
jgi:putative transposase